MTALETADRQETRAASSRSLRLQDKIAGLKRFMHEMQTLESTIGTAPDQQISLTDPDARSMATSGKGTGIVGYNVQTAVDAKHHLIVAHEVTNVGHDRTQLANMARQAKEIMGSPRLTVVADRGYYSGWEILACEEDGITPYVPKPLTSGAKFEGRLASRISSTYPRRMSTIVRRASASIGGSTMRRAARCSGTIQPLSVPDQVEAYRPHRPPFWRVADAAVRITRMLAELPHGGELRVFLPAVADSAPERALRCRAALASTFVAGLELAREGKAELDQAGVWQDISVFGYRSKHLL